LRGQPGERAEIHQVEPPQIDERHVGSDIADHVRFEGAGDDLEIVLVGTPPQDDAAEIFARPCDGGVATRGV